jgi:hypothetical protein
VISFIVCIDLGTYCTAVVKYILYCIPGYSTFIYLFIKISIFFEKSSRVRLPFSFSPSILLTSRFYQEEVEA